MLSAIFGRIRRKYNVVKQKHRRSMGADLLAQASRITEFASLTDLDRLDGSMFPGRNTYSKPKPMRNTWYVEDHEFDHTLIPIEITHPFLTSTPILLEREEEEEGEGEEKEESSDQESPESSRKNTLDLSTDSACCLSACEISPPLSCLFRCTSIQTKSLNLTRKRHERVKRRRGESGNSQDLFSSTESVTEIDGREEPKRKQPSTNQCQDDTDEAQSKALNEKGDSDDVNTVSQSDSGISDPESPSAEDEINFVMRTSSIHMKSWQIRRIRKQIQKSNKRLSASWEDLVKQQDELET